MQVGACGNRRGQSTLEYLLIAAAVIAAIAIAAGGVMRPAMDATMKNSGDAIKGAAEKFSDGLK